MQSQTIVLDQTSTKGVSVAVAVSTMNNRIVVMKDRVNEVDQRDAVIGEAGTHQLVTTADSPITLHAIVEHHV